MTTTRPTTTLAMGGATPKDDEIQSNGCVIVRVLNASALCVGQTRCANMSNVVCYNVASLNFFAHTQQGRQ
jgi:hypothetical protein